MKKKILILASGGGSNANSIMDFFQKNETVDVLSIISDNAEAGVHVVASKWGIPSYTFTLDQRISGSMHDLIVKLDPDLIVLAGYLKKISAKLVNAFENKIINIHPALLPKYGGKGMYGMNVHRAVITAKEKESGITIHFVNEKYDRGEFIKQVSCIIDPNISAKLLQKQVLKLEHYHYPRVIDKLLNR